jgi:hypothetical protein
MADSITTNQPIYMTKLCSCGRVLKLQLQDCISVEDKLSLARSVRFVLCPQCQRQLKRQAPRPARLPYADL